MIDRFLAFRETLFWKALLKIQEAVIVVCGALCCLIFVIEVIARYYLKVDFRGYDELVLFFAIWLYFIGGSYAMYKKEHINADMLSLVLKGRTLQATRVAVSCVTSAITVVLAVWGVNFFLYALTRRANTTVWRMPHLWSQAALTVGYILMAFYALMYAAEDTIRLLRGERTADAGTTRREGDEQ